MSEDEKKEKGLDAAQPPRPDVDKSRETRAAELSAEARAALAGFTARLYALIDKIDSNSDGPFAAEAAATAAQLRELKDEAAKLEKTFLQRLGAIARKPVEFWARTQKKMVEKQLEKVDNPKIIARLDKMLDNQEIPIEDCIELYQKAAKREYGRNWRAVETKLDNRILPVMRARLKGEDIKSAVKLFNALSKSKQEAEADEVMDIIWSPLSEGRQSDDEFSYLNYSARLATVQKYETRVEALIKSFPNLKYQYSDSRGRMYEKSFSGLELFLMKQKEEAVVVLADFDEATQRAIVKNWQTRAQDGSCWEKLLLDPRHLQLVPVFLDYPEAFSSGREEYAGRDIENLSRIAIEFPDTAQRKRLWKKTDAPSAQTLDSIYIYLSIASLPESTTEQIKQLDQEQLEHISLLIFSYGKEKLQEMWNEDNLLDLKELIDGKWVRRPDDWLIGFASGLTPTLRRHLPSLEGGGGSGFVSRSRPERTVWRHKGFAGVGRRLYDFKSAVECMPKDARERLFSVLRPAEDYSRSGYGYGNEDWPYLNNSEPEAFVEFCELTGFAGKFTLSQLVHERQWLKPDEWEKIKQGAETAKSAGLTLPGNTEHASLSGLLNFYKKVEQPEHERTNQFLKNCQSRSDKFLRKQDTRSNKKTEVAERGLGSAVELYYFSDACDQYFSKNPEAMAQFMNLSEDETVVIKKWVNGDIGGQTAGLVDLPAIEGIIVDLGHRFKDMRVSEKMERFAALTGEQQGVFLRLSKDIAGLDYGTEEDAEDLFNLTSGPEGVRLADFINSTGLKGYYYGVIKLMVTRPDCASLFYYFPPPGSSNFGLDLFKKMIALKDAGLPEKFCLAGFSEKLNLFSEIEIDNKFVNFEPQYLALAAQLAEKYFPELDLIELVKYLQPNMVLADLEKQMQMAGLLKESFYLRISHIPDQAEMNKMQSRLTATGDLFNSDLFKKDHQHSESRYRYRLGDLPENVWEVTQFSPETLKSVLVSERRGLPENATQLPRELLANSVIWQYKEIPDEMFENEQDLSDLLLALKIWQDGGVIFKGFIGIKPVCDSIINAYRNCSWLFKSESADVMKNHFTSIDYFSKLSESEWRGFQEYFNYFSFKDESEIKDAVTQARDGALPLSPHILDAIKSRIDKIPWASLAGIIEMFTQDADLEAVVELLEKNKHLAILVSEWNEPDWVGRTLFEGQEWRRVSDLPADVLRKLVDLQLTKPESYSGNEEKKKFLENSIFIAQHQNFDAIKDFINSDWAKKYHYHSVVIEAEPAVLNRFCEIIFPGFAKKAEKMPANLRFNILDLPDFLNLPDADKKIDFANQLLATFGDSFRVSIYDLMTINTDSAPDLLRALADKCFFALDDPKRLDGLAQVTTGEEQKLLEKLLGVYGADRAVDFSIAYDDIKTLPLNLRRAVLLEKGPRNYGWSILPFREQIIAELGLSQDEYRKLIGDIYINSENRYRTMPRVDLEIAEVILEKMKDNSLDTAFRDVLAHYDGDAVALFDWCLTNNLAVSKNLFPNWQSGINEALKDALLNNSGELIRVLATAESHEFFNVLGSNWQQVGEKDRKILFESEWFWLLFCQNVTPYSLQIYEQAPPGSISDNLKQDFVRAFLMPTSNVAVAGLLKFPDLRTIYEQQSAEIFIRAEEDPLRVLILLEKLQAERLLSAEHFAVIIKVIEAVNRSKQADESKDFSNEVVERLNRIMVEAIIQFDPTARQTFTDPRKLGILRESVVKNLSEFASKTMADCLADNHDSTVSLRRASDIIRHKIMEIKRSFDSSDSSGSDQRLMFVEMYDLTSTRAPGLAGKTREEIAGIVRSDVEEILARSGSKRELRYLARIVNDGNASEEKRAVARRYLDAAREALAKADRRNRGQDDYLPMGAITHGTSYERLSLILDSGNFSGEFLGSDTKADASGLFGMDVSLVAGASEGGTQASSNPNFSDRWNSQMNLSYGNIHLVYKFYPGDDEFSQRQPWDVGGKHRLVRTGVPSTEISAIIIKDAMTLESVKKDVASKGFYIPLLDVSDNLLLTENEFDEMKVIYNYLHLKGCSRKIIDDVYDFYKNPRGSEKHQIVIDKAVAAVRAGETIDLPVLVSFLRGNDLNTRDLAWYRAADIERILRIIKLGVGRKGKAKGREVILGQKLPENMPLAQRLSGKYREAQATAGSNLFLDNLFNRQLEFSGDTRGADKYEEAILDLMFTRKQGKDGGRARTLEIARMFTEQKKEVMRHLWEKVWGDLINDEKLTSEERVWRQKCRELLVPVVTGSCGRGDIVLGSDFDYLLLVDDESAPIENEQKLAEFVNGELSQKMNEVLQASGIIGDAGLARQDRQPFSKLSNITSFTIDLNSRRQAEEPTNIIDSAPLFPQERDRAVVEKARTNLVVENKSASLLDSYVLRDLEIPSEKFDSYNTQFEKLYESFAGGELLTKIKESLQRVMAFKLSHLLFAGFNTGRIPKEEAGKIPASTMEKIRFLENYQILTPKQADICDGLFALTYKLRFLGEIYSRESKSTELQKVSNVVFRTEDLSYNERERLFDLLTQFKEEILYK